VYVLVALGIIGGKCCREQLLGRWADVFLLGMSGTLTGLYFAHRKQRDLERSKRAQYWREQVNSACIGCGMILIALSRMLSTKI